MVKTEVFYLNNVLLNDKNMNNTFLPKVDFNK